MPCGLSQQATCALLLFQVAHDLYDLTFWATCSLRPLSSGHKWPVTCHHFGPGRMLARSLAHSLARLTKLTRAAWGPHWLSGPHTHTLVRPPAFQPHLLLATTMCVAVWRSSGPHCTREPVLVRGKGAAPLPLQHLGWPPPSLHNYLHGTWDNLHTIDSAYILCSIYVIIILWIYNTFFLLT